MHMFWTFLFQCQKLNISSKIFGILICLYQKKKKKFWKIKQKQNKNKGKYIINKSPTMFLLARASDALHILPISLPKKQGLLYYSCSH
jgi:hypothetical protein